MRSEAVRSEGVMVTPGIVRGEEVGRRWHARSRNCGDACSAMDEGVRGGGVGGRGMRRGVTCNSSAFHCSLCLGVMEEGSGGESGEAGREGMNKNINYNMCLSWRKGAGYNL